MRTKVLLGLAALAAGAATSMAQSNVYSLNIVGYVNKPTPSGYTFQSNPLDNGNNSATVVIPNPNPGGGGLGPWDGSSIQEWTGTGFKVSLFDSLTDDTTTGFTNPNGVPVPAPILTSGKGYLINNGNASNNITYVGQVRGPGTNTQAFAVRVTPYAIGSMLPLSGGVSTDLGFKNPNPGGGGLGPLDGASVSTLKVTGSGAAAGYRVALFDSLTDDTTTGFTDPNGVPVPEPSISMAGGFFFVNQTPSTYTWTQILTNSP